MAFFRFPLRQRGGIISFHTGTIEIGTVGNCLSKYEFTLGFHVTKSYYKLKTAFASEVVVTADKRSYRNLTGLFSTQKSTLNFQAFSLRDMKWRPEKAVEKIKR